MFLTEDSLKTVIEIGRHSTVEHTLYDSLLVQFYNMLPLNIRENNSLT